MFLLDKTLGKMGISEFYLNGLKKKKIGFNPKADSD